MIYTNFFQRFNRIYYRGRDNDNRRVQVSDCRFNPELYMKGSGSAKTIYGESLSKKEFKDIGEVKNFVKEYSDVMEIFGNTAYEYDFIHSNFKDELSASLDQLNVAIIDIETETEYGWPATDTAPEVVQLITISNMKGKMITFGNKPASAPNYINCGDEKQLLHSFINYIVDEDVDIISGWNSVYFDIAYLGTRILKILGKDALNRLSPFGWVEAKIDKINDREQIRYDIFGRTQLDLLDLYKKFRLKNRPRYKLDYIAQVELGERKLKSKYKTFKETYTLDWEGFVLYNQQDVRLVERLEEKLGFIYLAVNLAYMCKVNFADVYSPIKLWENYIKHTLKNRSVFVKTKKSNFGSDDSIEGGYVSEPVPGMYKWPISFDATSLYPSIIMALNMSPETLVDVLPGITTDTVKQMNLDVLEENQRLGYTLAVNGSRYRKDKPGILAELTKIVFDKRKVAKNAMLAGEAEIEKLDRTIDSDKIISLEREVNRNHIMQLAVKTLANSLFGAAANQYFMFYDNRIAEGITMTGQFIIQTVGSDVDKFMKNKFDSSINYNIYNDTDSCYIQFNEVVKKMPKNYPEDKVVTAIDEYIKRVMNPELDRITSGIADHLNVIKNTFSFKREAIASSGFWTGKKRYALRVLDNEGVRYAEPEIKIVGIETNRSSTPDLVRNWLTDAITIILETDSNDNINKFITEKESIFNSQDVDDIAFPRSANNLKQYTDRDNIYVKGAPIGVRSSLLYNHYLKKHKLEKEYSLIKESDKMKFVYLKTPNRLRENVISFVEGIPPEFGIDNLIDYNTQFDKVFLKPLTKITDALNWKTGTAGDLEDFF